MKGRRGSHQCKLELGASMASVADIEADKRRGVANYSPIMKRMFPAIMHTKHVSAMRTHLRKPKFRTAIPS